MPHIHRVLVVDDEPVVRDVLVDILDHEGHAVTACGTGKDAMRHLDQQEFDLVLLDIGLPDMDGFTAMSGIKSHSPRSLVVMVTGDATIESAVEALKSGAYDYLKKPIQIEELKKTINNALAHKLLDEARRTSEQALRDSEERFRALVENSLIGICIVQNNRIIYQNPEQERLYRTQVDVPLNKLLHFVHPDDTEKVLQGYRTLIGGVQESVEVDFRFYPSGRKSGNEGLRWVQCRATVFQYKGEDAILINIMDITRPKELEHILRVKSKMISLGRVAAGIAHEIRNPLTGVNSYLYTLEDLLDTEELSEDDLQMMKQIVQQMQVASNKIESVIKRVLDFSRPGAPSMSLINMNQPLEEAVKLSAVSLRKKGIQVETGLDEDLPRCYGDAHLIEQVVLNLIDNAVKAMEKHDGQKRLILNSYTKHNAVFLKVSDTGPGVPVGLREKIFDPFFTTETDGSGIGLAISQRIVNDHNGNIGVNGNKWGGASITIELPIDKRMGQR